MKRFYTLMTTTLLLAGLLSNAGCNEALSPLEERFENPYLTEAIQQQMAFMDFTTDFIQRKTTGKVQEGITQDELVALLRETLTAYETQTGQAGLVQQFDQALKLIERIASSSGKQLSDPREILDSLLATQGFSESQKSWMYRLFDTFGQTVAHNGTLADLRQALAQFDTDVYQALGEASTPILEASAWLYAANHALMYNADFWLSLLNPQAGKVGEVNIAAIICGIGFSGYGSIVTYALALGGVGVLPVALIGFGIGAVGAVVCAQA